MRQTPLTLAISTIIAMSSASVQASHTPSSNDAFQQMDNMHQAVQARLIEVKEKTLDPSNYEEFKGKKRFRYNNYLYDLSPDNDPMFFSFINGYEYADKSAAAMFDFVQPPWRLVNQMDGVFIYHEQFGTNYLNQDKSCNIQYLIGKNDNTNRILNNTKDCLPHQESALDRYGFIDELPFTNHLSGDLSAQVRFLQNQTADPNQNSEKEQQSLVSQRETLLVITPSLDAPVVDIEMSVYLDGELLKTQVLTPPKQTLETDRTVLDDRKAVAYSNRSYTAVLPWQWIQKGLSFSFNSYDGRIGTLPADQIDFGPDIHLDLPMIRIGMLTPPPAAKVLETQSAKYGSELFQRFPIASMTLAPYNPIHLEKVVMSNGDVKEGYSEYDNPGAHNGDMREDITKSLIQLGIANANFGVASSTPQQWQASHYPSIVIGHSRGRYKNKDGNVGDYTHGLSGGNGMVLLSGATGNEVTHEMGHAFGLGHYPGGYDIATHKITSGWGYDAYRSRFTDNLYWKTRVNGEYDYGNIQVTPYKTEYQYGTDPMGGGRADSSTSNYPLFTAYTSKRIQQNLTQKGHIQEKEGQLTYQKWDEIQQRWLPHDNPPITPIKQNTPVTTIVGFYDPEGTNTSYVYPALHGSSGKLYDLPAPVVGQCWAEVEYEQGTVKRIGLLGERQRTNLSNKLHFNLDPAETPETVSVYCPETSLESIVREGALAEYQQTRFYEWGENNRRGSIGDVFEYHRNGRVEFYQLNIASAYWYYPSSGQDNGTWKFLGYLDEWIAEKRPLLSFDALGKTLRDQRTLEKNITPPPKPTTIGKGQGYADAWESQPTFNQLSDLPNQDFATFEQFDAWIAKQYNQTHFYFESESRDIQRGNLHVNVHPQTGERLYFLRKTLETVPFPETAESTPHWKFLGVGDHWVQLNLNPLAFQQQTPLNLDAQLAKYVNQSQLFNADQTDDTNWYRTGSHSVFVREASDTVEKGYFLQRKAGEKSSLPTTNDGNAQWQFIGTEQQVSDWIQQIRQDNTEFERSLAAWYQQTQIQDWSSSGRGKVNDIYRYRFHDGKTHYFQLKRERYWYFPHPVEGGNNSNSNWQYLGHF